MEELYVDMIKAVKKKPALYDMNDPKYKDPFFRRKSWEELAEELKLRVSTVKSRWYRMVTNFRNAIMPTILDPNEPEKEWELKPYMEFTRPFVIKNIDKISQPSSQPVPIINASNVMIYQPTNDQKTNSNTIVRTSNIDDIRITVANGIMLCKLPKRDQQITTNSFEINRICDTVKNGITIYKIPREQTTTKSSETETVNNTCTNSIMIADSPIENQITENSCDIDKFSDTDDIQIVNVPIECEASDSSTDRDDDDDDQSQQPIDFIDLASPITPADHDLAFEENNVEKSLPVQNDNASNSIIHDLTMDEENVQYSSQLNENSINANIKISSSKRNPNIQIYNPKILKYNENNIDKNKIIEEKSYDEEIKSFMIDKNITNNQNSNLKCKKLDKKSITIAKETPKILNKKAKSNIKKIEKEEKKFNEILDVLGGYCSANKKQSDDLFFQSIMSDYQKLPEKQKRKFKARILSELNDLIDEAET